MAKGGRFADERCALCGVNPSSKKGEHVWPLWLLGSWESDGSGPYTYNVGGNPLAVRSGAWRSPNLIRVKLPACQDCNRILNDRYEQFRPDVQAFFDSEPLTGDQADRVALWLLKTWLLLSHPAVHYEVPNGILQEDVRPDLWNDVPNSAFRWLVAEPAEPVPESFSIWINRRGGDPVAKDERRHIQLPTIHADGEVTSFRSRCVTTYGLSVALIFHPGWEIEHPLEMEGRAVRVWPPTGTPIDMAVMPEVAANDTQYVNNPTITFEDGAFPDPAMTPLSAEGHMFDLIPGRTKIVSWGAG